MMNYRHFLFFWGIVWLAFAAPVHATEVRVGDTMRDVVVQLGAPSGEMSMGDRVVWMYSQGTIQFENGKVVGVDLSTPVGASTSGDLTEGLALYMMFDHDSAIVADQSEQGNHGMARDVVVGVSGRFRGAVEFFGDRGYIQLDRNITARAPYSVTAWVNLRSYRTGMAFPHYNGRTIFMRGDINYSGKWNYLFNVNANRRLGFVTHSSFSRADKVEAQDIFPLNSWVFVAFVHDGTTGRLYQGGKEVAVNTNMLSATRHNGRKTYIGMCFNSHPDRHRSNWDGFIDEFRFYTRALSPAEIQALGGMK